MKASSISPAKYLSRKPAFSKKRNISSRESDSIGNTMLVSSEKLYSLLHPAKAKQRIVQSEWYVCSARLIPDLLQKLSSTLNEEELIVLTKLLTKVVDRVSACGMKNISKRFELVPSANTVSHGIQTWSRVIVGGSMLLKTTTVKKAAASYLSTNLLRKGQR